MKKLFLFIAAVFCAASLTLNVQAKVLTFDFEGENPTIPEEWVNDETYPWTVVNNAPEGFGGEYCIKSGNSGVGSSRSTLEATFTFIGDGSISFDAGCWGEGTTSFWDKCALYMNDELQFSAGASQGWQNVSIEVSAGTHTFRWEYTKDGSVDPTGDAFYVDNIVVDLGVLPPTVEEDGWVHYDTGEYYSAMGLGTGAAFSWGIKIPAGTVTDTYLTKVSLYISGTANATVSIYQGGPTPNEATLLHTQDVTFTQTGVKEIINLNPSVEIDPTQDTWIVFNSPGYAASYTSYSVLANAVNGRWVEFDGEWKDIADVSDSYTNRAWMIRGLFASEPEYHPYVVNIEAKDIAATSANVSWDGFETFDLRYKKHNPIINNTFQDDDLGDWTTIDADGDGYNWVFKSFSDAGAGIGSASYIDYIGILNPDNYLVSHKFTIGDSITFEVMGVHSSDYQEHFGVAVSTTSNTDPETFTTIQEETIDASKTWKKYTVDLSAYKGQKGYVAIRHFNCTDQYWLLVKNVNFYPNPNPEQEDPDWTVVRSLNEAAYMLSELEPDQEYWVEVKAFYGDELTDWSETYKFRTLEDETGIEEVNAAANLGGSSKLLHDGHLFILRDGKIFNAQGARVK